MAAKTALLVIDVQRVLCEGEWAAFEAGPLVARIAALADRARRDGAPVVFIQHEEADGPMRHGSPGWQLAEGLVPQPGDTLLRKTTPDAFLRTELDAALKAQGVDRVVICGMQSDFCVDSTTRGALARGYPVVLASDGHSTLDNGHLSAAQIIQHHNVTLGSMHSFGPRVQLVPSAEIGFGG